jgi:hypothetical protein
MGFRVRATHPTALPLPDGQITSLNRNRVKPPSQKYSSSIFPKYMVLCARPAPLKEGRFAIVTSVGRGMRWTCWRRKTGGAGADGQVVWS